jgi:hypothetical protein
MLYDGRRVRALTVIDEGNREGLEITVGTSLPSRRVVRLLEDLVTVHGAPAAVRVDNHFASLACRSSSCSKMLSARRAGAPSLPPVIFLATLRLLNENVLQ